MLVKRVVATSLTSEARKREPLRVAHDRHTARCSKKKKMMKMKKKKQQQQQQQQGQQKQDASCQLANSSCDCPRPHAIAAA